MLERPKAKTILSLDAHREKLIEDAMIQISYLANVWANKELMVSLQSKTMWCYGRKMDTNGQADID